jgi:methylglutaconyl-CoA hydratase
MEFIEVQQDGRGVAEIRLAREDKHNALSAQMLTELEAAARVVAQDLSVRVVVLSARGPSFCAGGDLAWMREQFHMDRATRRTESARIATALGALYALPQPLIGRVQGNAFGGGIGLMSVCDLVVAADHVKLGLTEVKLGLIPANIGPYVIHRMGAKNAQEVFMNARIFGSDEGVRLGLINRVSTAETLDAAVKAEVLPYLNCAPGAVNAAKALLRQLAGEVSQTSVADAIEALADRWETEEAREGIAAFFDKRAAPWAQPD